MEGERPDIPTRTLYRIVWDDPPELDDFRSHAERGVEARNLRQETARLHDGLSMYRTLSQARRVARKRPPWLGSGHIARVTVPLDAEARIERTTQSAGHYTVWADARDLLSWVEEVVPVTPIEEAL